MQVDRKTKHAVIAPSGHCGNEFVGVAFGIPDAGIRIGPLASRLGILVVEDALHHSSIQQQSFNVVAAKDTTGVGGSSVDEKFGA